MKKIIIILVVALLSFQGFSQSPKTEIVRALTALQFNSDLTETSQSWYVSTEDTYNDYNYGSVNFDKNFYVSYYHSLYYRFGHYIGPWNWYIHSVLITEDVTAIEWVEKYDFHYRIVCEVKHRGNDSKISAKMYCNGMKVNDWDHEKKTVLRVVEKIMQEKYKIEEENAEKMNSEI
ncbi:hypothetical protein KKH82_03070 [Patescibacteria group bacterium]|nr:hypothetical protein [Patescibacteria group bacterium]